MDELAGSEIAMLKAIFSEIITFQSKLKHDFSVAE